jgi:hypothetical protein
MNYHVDTMMVKVRTVGELGYSGPESWVVLTEGRDTIKYDLDVVIPQNDTCGIEVDLYVRGGNVNGSSRYFVTTGDTIEIYHDWPKPLEPRGAKTVVYSKGNRHHVPGSEIPPWKQPPQDTTLKVLNPDSASGVDPAIIMRPEGKVDTIDDKTELPRPNLNSRMVDSSGWSTVDGLVEAAAKDIVKERDKTRELIVDLRKPEDYNYVKSLVSELIPCDTAGYYRAKLTHAQANEIHKHGITISSSRPAPGPHPAPKGLNQK